MTSKIEEALSKITKVKPKAKEDRQDFLDRMVEACDKLEDDDWEGLSKDAQKWVNTATKAADGKKEIPDFPDIEAEDDAEGGEEAEKKIAKDIEEEEEEEDPPAKKRAETSTRKSRSVEADEEEEETEVAAKKAKKDTSKSKTTEKKKTVVKNGTLPMGAPTLIKQMILKEPEITKDDLAAQLKKKGFKTSILTISTVRSDFRNSLRVLADAGWPKISV